MLAIDRLSVVFFRFLAVRLNVWHKKGPIMPTVAACPKCSKKYRVQDAMLGKRVKCSNVGCQHLFAVVAEDQPVVKKDLEIPLLTAHISTPPKAAANKGWNWNFLRAESDDVKLARIDAQTKLEAAKIAAAHTAELERIAVQRTAEVAKLAAQEQRQKAWSKFWFQLRIGFLAIFLGFFGLIAGLVLLGRGVANTSPQTAASIAPSQYPNQFHSTPTPAATLSDATSVKSERSGKQGNGKWVESESEKAYEKKNGVEVVHRKDGTTYERKAAKKK